MSGRSSRRIMPAGVVICRREGAAAGVVSSLGVAMLKVDKKNLTVDRKRKWLGCEEWIVGSGKGP